MEKLKVLVPTEFSVQAEYAFLMVKKISEQMPVEVHFLHVMNMPDTVSLDANGNVYVNQGSYYNVFRQGLMSDGSRFDELIGLDTFVNSVQTQVMNLLTSALKIPQTDDGVALIINKVVGACEDALSTGFIAPGAWLGPPILTIS